MVNTPNFNAQLTLEELELLRKLSAHLGYKLTTGPRAGDGSPRQLLAAIAQITQKRGVEHTAQVLAGLLELRL